jgi:hypothetical protein
VEVRGGIAAVGTWGTDRRRQLGGIVHEDGVGGGPGKASYDQPFVEYSVMKDWYNSIYLYAMPK